MTHQKRRISGPGASDFLSAPGGEDLPGSSPSKGRNDVTDDPPLTDPRNLEPEFDEDANAVPQHKERGVPRGRDGD